MLLYVNQRVDIRLGSSGIIKSKVCLISGGAEAWRWQKYKKILVLFLVYKTIFNLIFYVLPDDKNWQSKNFLNRRVIFC